MGRRISAVGRHARPRSRPRRMARSGREGEEEGTATTTHDEGGGVVAGRGLLLLLLLLLLLIITLVIAVLLPAFSVVVVVVVRRGNRPPAARLADWRRRTLWLRQTPSDSGSRRLDMYSNLRMHGGSNHYCCRQICSPRSPLLSSPTPFAPSASRRAPAVTSTRLPERDHLSDVADRARDSEIG